MFFLAAVVVIGVVALFIFDKRVRDAIAKLENSAVTGATALDSAAVHELATLEANGKAVIGTAQRYVEAHIKLIEAKAAAIAKVV